MRSVRTLTRSVSEGHNIFPRLRFGLVSLRAAMSHFRPLAGARDECVGSRKDPVIVKSRGWTRWRVRPLSARNRANDDPPGTPRWPRYNADCTKVQVSPGASGI